MIIQQTGPVSFKFRECDTDKVFRRHRDQLRPTVQKETVTSEEQTEFQEPDIEVADQQQDSDMSTSHHTGEHPPSVSDQVDIRPCIPRRSQRTDHHNVMYHK